MTPTLPPAILYFLERGYQLQIWLENGKFRFKLHGETEGGYDLLLKVRQAQKELETAELTMNFPESEKVARIAEVPKLENK